MIVKIWPIKNSYGGQSGLVGGIRGLSNAFDYISDENKCIVNKKDIELAYMEETQQSETSFIEKEEDIVRAMNYMSNNDKVKGKYISGYMCRANNAKEDFLWAQNEINRMNPNKNKDGNIAYHIVQSFPEDINISDEEVHQCGIELVRKIEKHQAFICSHVHPEIDEEGEIHGRCKHNHILINAYIHPDKIDPENPNVFKYNDCKETYKQLQIWNDEIALEHGFPIITNPDLERTYSWKENDSINKGLSWKQQVRNDIDNTKQKVPNWKEFAQEMYRLGYIIKEGKQTTFIAPDGIHRVRGENLGKRFTKENIQKYWDLRNEIRDEILNQESKSRQYTIKDLINNSSSQICVEIPLGDNQNSNTTAYLLSLDKKILNKQAIDSYFNPEQFYELKNEQNQVVDSVSGLELHRHFTEMLKAENERYKQMKWWNNEKEKRKWQQLQEQERKEKQYYENERFRNSRNNQTYKIGLYNKNGRLKTDLELIFTMAIIIIHNEQGFWEPKEIPKNRVREAYFGPPVWKAQNMMDAIQIAREEGIDNQFDMENRLQNTGAALSRARATVKRNERVKNSMETLKKTIDEYEKVQEVAKNILNMPEGNNKLQLLHENKDIIEQYTKSKELLHIYKIKKMEDILDFKKRYAQVEKNIEESQQLLDEKKEEYRRLKKLEYSTSLAQDVYYCYGPEYKPARKIKTDYEHTEPPMQE